MRCNSAVELVTDYLEDALPRVRRIRLRHHLAACRGCTVYLDQLRATIRVVALAARLTS